MKLFAAYLKQHIKLIIAAVGFFAIFAVCFALYHLPLLAVIYPAGLSLLLIALLTATDFGRVKAKHEQLSALNEVSAAEASALPPEDWFSIDSIVADLRLTALARRERVLDGYFLDSAAPDGE